MFYSIEFLINASTIFFTLAKFNQSTKYMLKFAKEILAKGFKLQTLTKHQNDANVMLVLNFL